MSPNGGGTEGEMSEARAKLAVVGTEAAVSALVAAAYTDQVGAILGAASVPIISSVVEAVVERRADSFRRKLENAGVTPELLAHRIGQTPAFIDLVATATSAALSTDMEEKRSVLASYLSTVILDDATRDLAFDRRVLSCLARIDAVEVRVLALLRAGGSLNRSALDAQLGSAPSDILDTVTAVVISEGLVIGSLDTGLSMTSFGLRVVAELEAVESA